MSSTLEPVMESRDAVQSNLAVNEMLEEFREELGVLQCKRDIITDQREQDSLLMSANQMWKARSSYMYQHKNDLEIRKNHIDSMNKRAKDIIIEVESLESVNEPSSGPGGTPNNNEFNLAAKVKELQHCYYAVNDTYNKMVCLVDEILADIVDYIQNAAIYEHAKNKLESKLSALEYEYSPEGMRQMQTSLDKLRSDSNGTVASSGNRSDGANSTTTPREPGQYVLHETTSQPNSLPGLEEQTVEDLEFERTKLRHVMSTIFDDEAKEQLGELKQILEEVDLSSDCVREEITALIERFEKEESAALNRGEEIEKMLVTKTLNRTLESSVRPPWRRVISPDNGLPIYMNDDPNSGGPHMSLQHPEFTKIQVKLLTSSIFREVRDTNYRIGKQATYLQFKLFGSYWTNWQTFLPKNSCSLTVDLTNFLPYIQKLYESVSDRISAAGLAQAMDCFYNLLIQTAGAETTLNGRTAQTFVVFLSNANFEEKLMYLFSMFQSQLISDALEQEPMISLKDFHLMLQKILIFTKFLDEESYEQMEQSMLMEIQNMNMFWIRKSQFIEWASQRPLIIDWMRCHDEFVQTKPSEVKHQVKCNQCLVYPIEGILFKCEQCPDFDLCDTCYLSKAYYHKETHSFQSITKPLIVNRDLLQGSLMRKISKTAKFVKTNQDFSSGENSSTSERKSSKSKPWKRKTSKKSKLDHKTEETYGDSGHEQTNEYCSVIYSRSSKSVEMMQNQRVNDVIPPQERSHYNSLKLQPQQVAMMPDSGVSTISSQFERQNSKDFNSYEYVECPTQMPPVCAYDRYPTPQVGYPPPPVLNGGTQYNQDIFTPSDQDEHFSIQSMLKLLSQGTNRNDVVELTQIIEHTVEETNEIENKAITDKVNELEDKFCDLFSHVQTISKTAGITLSDGSEGEIRYDSVISVKFASEIEQVAFSIIETIQEMNTPEPVQAKSTIVGGQQQDAHLSPVTSFVVPLNTHGSGKDVLNSGKESVSEWTSCASSELTEHKESSRMSVCEEEDFSSENEHFVNTESVQWEAISKFCSNLVENCIRDGMDEL